MKKILAITIVLMMWALCGMAQSGAEKKELAEKKAAEERSRAMGGTRNSNAYRVAEDTGGQEGREREVSSEAGRDEQDNADAQSDDNASNDNAEKSNAPAVIQRSTSESGSPSILSDNNGRGRDGTGNVQRSTPNMAGSPVPEGIRIRDDGSTKNQNTGVTSQVRQQEEQPQADAPTPDVKRGEPGQAAKKEGEQNDRKAKRKARKAKKDSGD